MDQAGWHMSNNLVVPGNITILPLPPKSPELNPVENIWHFMRDNWLSNRVFKSRFATFSKVKKSPIIGDYQAILPHLEWALLDSRNP